MISQMNHWLVKQEPIAYSWDNFVADGKTAWTGVRNYQARNNLKAMRKGDRVLFYHSVEEKAVVGIAKVEAEAYPDPTAIDGAWICVDLVPLKPLKKPDQSQQIARKPRTGKTFAPLSDAGHCARVRRDFKTLLVSSAPQGGGQMWKSGGGPPQSKKLPRRTGAQPFALASWRAPALWRFGCVA